MPVYSLRIAAVAALILAYGCKESHRADTMPDYAPMEASDPTPNQLVCEAIPKPAEAPRPLDALHSASNDDLWREYRYITMCLEDDGLRAAPLRELANRGDVQAMEGLGIMLLYNMDARDDTEAVMRLERAATLGSDEAQKALDEWRQARQ